MASVVGRPARVAYPTDLTETEWERLAVHLPADNPRGRPRKHPVREILDAIFYVIRGGCAWRLLLHDFPPWGTVYYWFRQWRLDELWQYILIALRPAHAEATRNKVSGILTHPLSPSNGSQSALGSRNENSW